ncbi:MAG: COX15/CtaA family protein, partial [Acidobacteriota bacterium]|nr:COX15/CtaA family protein [Acidobacteriota bacterium]
MTHTLPDPRQRRADRWGPALVGGFGIAVAMWGLGYFGRLPTILLPAPPLLVGLVLCPVIGGLWLRRYPNVGGMSASLAGFTAGAINLLVLGSFVVDAQGSGAPSPAIWIPGSILITGVLAGLGYAVGTLLPRAAGPVRSWSSALAWVAVIATMVLLAAGGIVTSEEAGLAVVDWPNSFQYNMFLYPFSKMTGPVFYEHAHRLLGALVGLTTLVLTVFLWCVDDRKRVRRFALAALVLVTVQGILGGLRVTGKFTLSDDPSMTSPSLMLATVHGVLAQLFFSVLVALTAFTSPLWRSSVTPVALPSARGDRRLGIMLIAAVVLQLVLGAVQRHFDQLLMIHMATGIALVTPLAIHVGMRSWGRSETGGRMGRLGVLLAISIPLQLVLGIAAFVATRMATAPDGSVSGWMLFATAHQWFGAWIL